MSPDWRTTIGGIVSGLGSVLVAAGVFYPPLQVAGGIISGLGKVLLGTTAADKANVISKVG